MINAAIIGLGWWGKTLVEAVQNEDDNIRFIAGCTHSNSPEAQDFASSQGFQLSNSYSDIINNPEIDAVVLATPHSSHVPQIIEAVDAGKHVFTEKPFALTRAEAESAISAVNKAGVTLGLGYKLSKDSNSKNLIWLRTKLSWSYPHKLSTLFAPSIQVGYSHTL